MILAVCGMSAQQACSAEDSAHRFATDASNAIGPFLVIGELSLLSNGKAGKAEMIQGAKALAVTALFTQALKYTVGEDRPHSESDTSFPSGHASEAFAMATVLADYKPHSKWVAYGTATAIAWSRVQSGAHHWQDVVAGAALGHFTAKHFTNQHLDLSARAIGYKWTWSGGGHEPQQIRGTAHQSDPVGHRCAVAKEFPESQIQLREEARVFQERYWDIRMPSDSARGVFHVIGEFPQSLRPKVGQFSGRKVRPVGLSTGFSSGA
jgi:hypothetical protein